MANKRRKCCCNPSDPCADCRCIKISTDFSTCASLNQTDVFCAYFNPCSWFGTSGPCWLNIRIAGTDWEFIINDNTDPTKWTRWTTPIAGQPCAPTDSSLWTIDPASPCTTFITAMAACVPEVCPTDMVCNASCPATLTVTITGSSCPTQNGVYPLTHNFFVFPFVRPCEYFGLNNDGSAHPEAMEMRCHLRTSTVSRGWFIVASPGGTTYGYVLDVDCPPYAVYPWTGGLCTGGVATVTTP